MERAVIGVLNGPNLGRLGRREPEIYGTATLADLEKQLRAEAEKLRVAVEFFQSNNEGSAIDQIEQWTDGQARALIVNAGAWTHTSVALRDALVGSSLPVVEVHLSNVYTREEFRHHSFLSDIALGVIAGLGLEGYRAALRYLAERVR